MAWVRTDETWMNKAFAAIPANGRLPLGAALPLIAALSGLLWIGIVRLAGAVL